MLTDSFRVLDRCCGLGLMCADVMRWRCVQTGYPVRVPDVPKGHLLTSACGWTAPTVDSLRGAMRAVYVDHRDQGGAESARRAMAARRYVMEHHSPELVARSIAAAVDRIEKIMTSSGAPMKWPASSKDEPEIVTLTRHTGEKLAIDLAACLVASPPDRPPITTPVSARHSARRSATPKGPRKLRVAFLSTYPPNPCGIAMFTENLMQHMQKVAQSLSKSQDSSLSPFDLELHLYVLLPETHTADILPDVPPNFVAQENMHIIRTSHALDYTSAAAHISDTADALVIQHEYGIFGGQAGSYVVCLARAVSPKVRIVTVLHTVFEYTNEIEHAVLIALYELSYRMVVMTQLSRMFLDTVEGITDSKRVVVIPHGVPDIPYVDPNGADGGVDPKARFGWSNRTVILSTGFHNPTKGMNSLMKALPLMVKEVPNILYVIGGDAHPNCGLPCRHYSDDLPRIAAMLNLEKHVQFVRSYLTKQQMLDLYNACDYFSALYTHPFVSSSGTVSQALAAGRIPITTPFTYTKETLRDEHGIVVPFEDPVQPTRQQEELARAIIAMHKDPERARRVRLNAYQRAQSMTWPRVARAYLELFLTD
jgi:glycosyltransferase involved in cell wall biosynthesis